MKAPITSAQAMQHPTVVETINTLSQLAEELRVERDALQAENERLKRDIESQKTAFNAVADALNKAAPERDALKSKLDAMGKGDPTDLVAVQWSNIQKVVRAAADWAFSGKDHPEYGHCWLAVVNSLTAQDGLDITALRLEPLYAAPKALAPRFTECRIELVGAIHTLASHYENRLGRLDPEDRKLAEGDIAHAMATAAKWNWNGNGIGSTP